MNEPSREQRALAAQVDDARRARADERLTARTRLRKQGDHR